MTLSFQRLAGAIIISLSLISCTTVNPATGKSDFTPFMSPTKEAAVGKQAHPGILVENGGVYDDPNVGAYVATVGGRLAAVSEMNKMPFTFTVLNTPLVNAFALPGGYVYVTRGILALFNSEAEMASVIGHEIGHVTARHSAKRYNRQIFTGLLSAGLGAVVKNDQLGEIIGQGSQLYLMGYSRGQEYQSDGLGVRYSTRAGFDPFAAADMLGSLDGEHKLQDLIANRSGQERQSEFFSTHPNTQDRVTRAREAARQSGVAPGSRGRGQDNFFGVIDGMIYGDDPKEGLVRGQLFWHKDLKLTFSVPENYKIQNSRKSVVAVGSGAASGGVVMFSGGNISGKNLIEYASVVWKELAGDRDLQGLQDIQINGMDAVTGWSEGRLDNQDYIMRLVAIRFSESQAYQFMILTPAAKQNALSEGLQRMTYSFRRLAKKELDKYKARRIKIVTVRKGDSATSLARRMAFKDYPLERFLVLNGLQKNSILKTGQKVKLIVE